MMIFGNSIGKGKPKQDVRLMLFFLFLIFTFIWHAGIVFSARPYITDVMIVSSDDTPIPDQMVNAGDQVMFVIKYSDEDGYFSSAAPTERFLICNESSCYHCSNSDYSLCIAYNLDAYNNSEGFISSSLFTVPTSPSGSYTYYVRLYDGTNYSSNDMQAFTFSVNLRPYATDVEIRPYYPEINDTLICNYSFMDMDGHDPGDSPVFRWYKKINNVWVTLEGTSKTLANPPSGAPFFEVGDEMMCGVLSLIHI